MHIHVMVYPIKKRITPGSEGEFWIVRKEKLDE